MKKYHENNVMHINHFTLLVKNIEVSIKFYQEVLGLDLVKVENEYYHLGIEDKVLFTLKTNENVISKTKTTGLYHFALLLPKRSDLSSFLYNIVVNEVLNQGGSDHGVSEAVYLADPDNNGIEIYVDKETVSWPTSNTGVNMVTERLNYEELISQRLNDKPFKMPKETIIGHMHFHVNNLSLAKSFFVDTIGFNIMQNMYSALFISDSNYHHHLGLNIWNGENVINRANNMVGLVNYHLNVDENKLTSLIDNLKEKDITIYNDDKGRYIYDINNVKMYF